MRMWVTAAAAAMAFGIAAPSAAHAQATVNVSVTILPSVESSAMPPVQMHMAAGGLRVDAAKPAGSDLLRSVRVDREVQPAERREPVRLVQVIAANS